MLTIRRGSLERSKQSFDLLLAHRDEIERTYLGHLTWERRSEIISSYIKTGIPGRIAMSDAELKKLQSWAVHMVIRLKRTFGPWIRDM